MYTYGSEDCEWVHESTAEGPHSGDGEVQIVSLKGVYRKMFYLYFPDGPLINRLKMIKFGFDLAEIFNPKVWRRKNPRLAIFRLSQMGSNNEKRRGQNLVTPSLKSIMSKHAKIEHFRKILLI